MLRSQLLDFDEKWSHNSAYHHKHKSSSHVCNVQQDPRIPYETILAPTPLEDPTMARRATEMGQVFEIAKSAILSTQGEAQETDRPCQKANQINIGDLVYLRDVAVSRHASLKECKNYCTLLLYLRQSLAIIAQHCL